MNFKFVPPKKHKWPLSGSFWLPDEWSKTIPVQDQRWTAKSIFHSGKLCPDFFIYFFTCDGQAIYP